MVDERGRRPRTEGDVEQDISCGRLPAAPSRPRDDAANLLVARPEKAELDRHCPDAPVGLGDRSARVVETLGSRDEARVDARSELEHIGKDAPSQRTRGARNETKKTK